MTNTNDWIVELSSLHTELIEYCTPSIEATDYSHALSEGGAGCTAAERMVDSFERIEADWRVVELVAYELGWQGQRVGNPAMYIYSRQAWAEKHYPTWGEMLNQLKCIHQAWEDFLNVEPLSDYTCPACLEARLRHHRNGGLACRSCEWYGTAEDYRNMLTFRISTSEAYITREQARSLYPELKTATLRKWIERGKLVETSEGIPIKELDTLMPRLLNRGEI